ncbi:MAG: HNH endonuclease signature motif containing protein [Patescibacteria group bacterium]
MTILELVNLRNIRALLAVFFNLVDDDETYFYIKSEYRDSAFAPARLNSFNYLTLNTSLNSYFNLNFESLSLGKHLVKITKTSEINTSEKFLAEIYKQIQLLSFDIETEKYEEAILLSLFILRGSPDFTAKYYAVDIYRKYSSKEYIRNIFQILSGISAISQLNLNFRELQPQFTAGRNLRNTQIRIKLGWFWEKFGEKIREINNYKYSILNNNTDKISEPSISIGNFSDRLVEYLNNILGEENHNIDIKRERQRLGLEASGAEARDFSLKTIANNIFPDECMACKTRFNTNTRTFKLRNQDKHYFEIHHIIPFSKGKEHDQIDNLAKICPVCHRILTKNRAEEALQKQTIKDILESSENAQKYVSILIGDTNINNIVDFVYMKLA